MLRSRLVIPLTIPIPIFCRSLHLNKQEYEAKTVDSLCVNMKMKNEVVLALFTEDERAKLINAVC
jgi:hypothetical protein